MEKDQERKVRNFDPKTGKKINPTCAFCWVKKIENYNCGFEECPGFDLHRIEMLKKRRQSIEKCRKKERMLEIILAVATSTITNLIILWLLSR